MRLSHLLFFFCPPAILRRFTREEGGNVAIEFAIIAFVGFLLTMGIMEFALLIYANSALNNAVKEIAYDSASECPTLERGNNGLCTGAHNATVNKTHFDKVLKKYATGLINTDEICIFAHPIVSGSTGSLIPDPGPVTDFGGSEDIVRIDFRYRWNFFTAIISNFFPNQLIFQANFLIRNGEIADASNRKLPTISHANCAGAYVP